VKVKSDSEADEISPEALAELNALLEQGPGEDASEEEVEAFMKKFSETSGGAAMLKTLTEQLAEGGGGTLNKLLGQAMSMGGNEIDWSNYHQPESPLRLVFRIQPVGAKMPYWRRLSLPADACFLDLHYALVDVFDLTEGGGHRFELRESGKVTATFLSGGAEVAEGDDYCELQNRPLDLFSEGAERLFYLLEGGEFCEFAVFMEKLIEPSSFENEAGFKPDCLGGEGPLPETNLRNIEFRVPSMRV
jgi:hypothetical protein